MYKVCLNLSSRLAVRIMYIVWLLHPTQRSQLDYSRNVIMTILHDVQHNKFLRYSAPCLLKKQLSFLFYTIHLISLSTFPKHSVFSNNSQESLSGRATLIRHVAVLRPQQTQDMLT